MQAVGSPLFQPSPPNTLDSIIMKSGKETADFHGFSRKKPLGYLGRGLCWRRDRPREPHDGQLQFMTPDLWPLA